MTGCYLRYHFVESQRMLLFISLLLSMAVINIIIMFGVGLLERMCTSYFEQSLPSYTPIVENVVNNNNTKTNRLLKLWPEEKSGDRIENQLKFLPGEVPLKTKTILMFNGLLYGDSRTGSEAFSECAVKSCYVSTNQKDAKDADAILFRNYVEHPNIPKSPEQVWILYTMESPYHTTKVQFYENLINWTVTYRSDSDLVIPYGKWIYYKQNILKLPETLKNFAANKTKKVAWFVSNCHSANNRLEYALELQKYIQVDIYGRCGNLSCPKDSDRSCLRMVSPHYKFYLAFENSNCQDYITEKFFVNSLQHEVLPIVMGARPEEYRRWAPNNSYIHVEEFQSPRHLAEYLHKLDTDDDLYNSYFKWKGTGEVITNTHLYCRLCAMLHSDPPHKWYPNFLHWWRQPETCTDGYWRDT